MTLIDKLEDSEEGLMGITKSGERVHLGVPSPSISVHSLKTDNYDTAYRRRYEETAKFEQELDVDKRYYYYFDSGSWSCVTSHTSDIPLRRWFNDGKFLRNESVIFTYFCFEKKKEEAFQRSHEDGYYPEREGSHRVKIHRMEVN